MDTCVMCGRALTQPATGRPRRYCSTGCRRAADLEVRRLDRHLDQLEQRLRWANLNFWMTGKDEIEKIEQLIDLTKRRLITLLDVLEAP